MLMATVLSQNTNDKNSHRAYTRLTEKYPEWRAVAEAPARGIRAAIRTGGMADQKSRRIKEILAAVYAVNGEYDLAPLSRMGDEEVIEWLTRMKGIGLKTASCVLLFSLGRDVFPVDTHVHRLCTRLGLAPGSRNPEQTFAAMKGLIPKGKGYSLHTNLIRFGRKVCRANNPVCGICPLASICVYPGKTKRPNVCRTSSRADHDFMLLDNV